MRSVICLLLSFLCLLPVHTAWGEDTMIEPDYPVPVYVQRLLEVAQSEIGYVEAPNGYTKYGENKSFLKGCYIEIK